MAKDVSVGVNLYGNDKSASKALKGVGNEAERLGHKMVEVSDRIIKGMAMAATAAAAVAVKVGVDSVKAASDYNETLSKTKTIFGESSAAAIKFADSSATMLGQSKTQALDAMGQFALFAKVAGKSGKGALDFSKKMTTLSADLASFYNSSPEEAITAIGAAMRGEQEPIRKFNVLIDDAAMKQVLMEKHLYKGKGTLTAQQKVMAAYMLILKQTKVAQGDFAKTAGGLANQQRILAAQFENVKIKLGTMLMPYVQEFAQYVNDTLIPAIEAWVEANGPKIRKMIDETMPKVQTFIGQLMNLGQWAIEHKDVLWEIAKVITSIAVGIKAAATASAIVSGLKTLIGVYKTLTATAATATVAEAAATGGVSLGAAAIGMAGAVAALGTYGIMSGALDFGGAQGKDTKITQPEGSRWKLQGGARLSDNGVMGNYWNRSAGMGGQAPIVINVRGSVVTERDLVRSVRDAITVANRRQGADVTVTGRGKK